MNNSLTVAITSISTILTFDTICKLIWITMLSKNYIAHPGVWNMVCGHIVKTERNIRVMVAWCSCWTGVGRGRGTPKYCRSMDCVGSTELNFNPTRVKNINKINWEMGQLWNDCWSATDLPAAQDGWLVCISRQVVPVVGTFQGELTSPHQSQDQLRDKNKTKVRHRWAAARAKCGQ